MYIFNGEGVFKFYCGPKGDPDWYEIQRRTTLPKTMWALIDANQNLIEVPLAYHGRYFVVQASSRPDHFAWQDKVDLAVTTIL